MPSYYNKYNYNNMTGRITMIRLSAPVSNTKTPASVKV